MNRALYKQDVKSARVDDKLESTADRAARLNAKAAWTGAGGDVKRAAAAAVDVQKAVRAADRAKDAIADKAATKIDNALDRQVRREDRAADKVGGAAAGGVTGVVVTLRMRMW